MADILLSRDFERFPMLEHILELSTDRIVFRNAPQVVNQLADRMNYTVSCLLNGADNEQVCGEGWQLRILRDNIFYRALEVSYQYRDVFDRKSAMIGSTAMDDSPAALYHKVILSYIKSRKSESHPADVGKFVSDKTDEGFKNRLKRTHDPLYLQGIANCAITAIPEDIRHINEALQYADKKGYYEILRQLAELALQLSYDVLCYSIAKKKEDYASVHNVVNGSELSLDGVMPALVGVKSVLSRSGVKEPTNEQAYTAALRLSADFFRNLEATASDRLYESEKTAATAWTNPLFFTDMDALQYAAARANPK